jgi:PmbA protein
VIEQVIEAARARGEGADALWHRVERTSVSFESGRLKACGVSEEAGLNLRILKDGRIGIAGTTAERPGDLLERAVASAALGESVPLVFPSTTRLPNITTFSDAAANASLDQLTAFGTELVGRLSREGCQVNVGIERETIETRFLNTAGAQAAYPATAVSVGVDLARFAGDDVLMVYDVYSGSDLPGPEDLDALVASIDRRYSPALRVVDPPDGSLPVVFTPSGWGAILLPLEQALSGKAVLQGVSPLADKVGQRLFDERFSIVDDPLAPGRPASRPVDDEGVASNTLPLIADGVVRHFVYDLETAARAKAISTGHGVRGTFSKPRIGYSNLIIGPTKTGKGDGGRGKGRAPLGGGLLGGIENGLVVDDLIGVGQGNVMSGAFSHPVALAYRIENSEVTGRVKDAAVAGNVYELLKRIAGFGDDGRWMGNRWAPSLLLEGVSVARR